MPLDTSDEAYSMSQIREAALIRARLTVAKYDEERLRSAKMEATRARAALNSAPAQYAAVYIESAVTNRVRADAARESLKAYIATLDSELDRTERIIEACEQELSSLVVN